MRKLTGYIVLVILIFICNHHLAKAQQPEETSLLPDIDPQDIEIRGNFTAQFLGLNRQPILGFNPTPPVYQIDPNRTPFMESPDQILANLPVSRLSRPTPPSLKVMSFPRQRNLYSSFGFGRFSSPEGELYGNYQLNEQSGVLIDGQFHSSDGHFDNPQTSFRFFNGKAAYILQPTENQALRVSIEGQSDFNHTFDIGSKAFLPITPEKEYTGFNTSVHYQNLKNSFSGWNFDANIQIFNTDLLARQLSGENDETIFSGSVERQFAGKNLNEVFTLSLSGLAGDYETDTGIDDNWSTLKGGAAYKRTFSSKTTLDIGAHFFAVDNEIEDSDFYVLPDVTITHWITDKIKASLIARGEVFALSNKEHHETNRFLTTNLDIKHTRTLEGIARVDYELRKGTIVKGGISYLDAEDYAFYLRQDIQGNAGFFESFYGDANIIKGFMGLTHYLVPERFWIDIEATIQNRELDSNDFGQLDEVPFMEHVSSKVTLSYDSGKSFKVRAWGDFVSSRFSPQTPEDLDSFFFMGLRTDYTFGERLGIYLKGVNLFNETYEVWQGYEERPIQLYGGVTFRL